MIKRHALEWYVNASSVLAHMKSEEIAINRLATLAEKVCKKLNDANCISSSDTSKRKSVYSNHFLFFSLI